MRTTKMNHHFISSTSSRLIYDLKQYSSSIGIKVSDFWLLPSSGPLPDRSFRIICFCVSTLSYVFVFADRCARFSVSQTSLSFVEFNAATADPNGCVTPKYCGFVNNSCIQ